VHVKARKQELLDADVGKIMRIYSNVRWREFRCQHASEILKKSKRKRVGMNLNNGLSSKIYR
jgi:hypothetical protein